MKDPYKVLGVSPDASDDEIKKAYRAPCAESTTRTTTTEAISQTLPKRR